MDDLVSATIGNGKDIEDDKERAIAKAALSIAELGSSHFLIMLNFQGNIIFSGAPC